LNLSDGSVSEQIGAPGVAFTRSHEFSDKEIIKSISIGGKNTVEAIQFCGAGGEILI